MHFCMDELRTLLLIFPWLFFSLGWISWQLRKLRKKKTDKSGSGCECIHRCPTSSLKPSGDDA
jgi:cytochrome oxidase assembly protein ShyY1